MPSGLALAVTFAVDLLVIFCAQIHTSSVLFFAHTWLIFMRLALVAMTTPVVRKEVPIDVCLLVHGACLELYQVHKLYTHYTLVRELFARQ